MLARRLTAVLLFLAGSSSLSAQVFWTETFSDETTATANWIHGGTNGGSLEWDWTDVLTAGNWLPGSFGSPTGSTGYMWFNSDGNGDFDHDVTLTGDGHRADCTGRANVHLRFYTLFRIFNEGYSGQVGISVNGTDYTWHDVPEFQGLDGGSASTDRYEGWVDLAVPEADGQSEVWVRFRWLGHYEYYWKVDDLEMYAVPGDIDGDGEVNPLTDGLLYLRYLFGLRGLPLVAGAVDPDCTRCTPLLIQAHIETLLPP